MLVRYLIFNQLIIILINPFFTINFFFKLAELFEEIAKDYASNPENAQKEEGNLITLTETQNSRRFCYC